MLRKTFDISVYTEQREGTGLGSLCAVAIICNSVRETVYSFRQECSGFCQYQDEEIAGEGDKRI